MRCPLTRPLARPRSGPTQVTRAPVEHGSCVSSYCVFCRATLGLFPCGVHQDRRPDSANRYVLRRSGHPHRNQLTLDGSSTSTRLRALRHLSELRQTLRCACTHYLVFKEPEDAAEAVRHTPTHLDGQSTRHQWNPTRVLPGTLRCQPRAAAWTNH